LEKKIGFVEALEQKYSIKEKMENLLFGMGLPDLSHHDHLVYFVYVNSFLSKIISPTIAVIAKYIPMIASPSGIEALNAVVVVICPPKPGPVVVSWCGG
jgi:hypothetical protein